MPCESNNHLSISQERPVGDPLSDDLDPHGLHGKPIRVLRILYTGTLPPWPEKDRMQ